MRNSMKPYAGASALALFLAANAFPAVAQDADQVSEVETIVVTAQKRSQALHDVPISVNVVSGEDVGEKHITDVKSLSTYVPNLMAGDSPGDNQVTMRGLGTGARNPLFEQAVVTYIDGVSGSRSLQFIVPFFDVSRVEVLRGPQGVLFGKNATAGAINIVSASPTDYLTAEIGGHYEAEYQGWGVDGYVSGPLTEKLNGRLAVKKEVRGAYVRDTFLNRDRGEEDTFAVRGMLEWTPTEDLTLQFKAEHAQYERIGNVLEIGACTTNLALILAASPTEDCKMNRVTAQETMGGDKAEATSATVNIEYQRGAMTFSSITGFSTYDSLVDRDTDLTPAYALIRRKDEQYQQVSQEFRVASPADWRVSFVAGIYGQSQDLDIFDQIDTGTGLRPFSNLDSAPFNPTTNYRLKKLADQSQTLWSAYAQATWNMTDALRLIAGARYSEEKKRIDYRADRYEFGSDIAAPTDMDIDVTGRVRRESSFDPQITIQYDLASNVVIYGTGSMVHKAGGFNIDETNGHRMPVTFEYRPEEAQGVEIGLKAGYRRGFINVALFQTDFSDLQVSSYDGVTSSVRNAADARTRGVEIDGRWRLGASLTLNGSLAYLDAKFVDYPGGACTAAEAALVAPAACSKNLAGNRLTLAPEWAGTIGLDYRADIANGLTMIAGGNLNYKADYFTQESNDPVQLIRAATTLDLRSGVEWGDGAWSATISAKNVTDELRPSFTYSYPRAPGAYGVSTPRGREVFFEVRRRW